MLQDTSCCCLICCYSRGPIQLPEEEPQEDEALPLAGDVIDSKTFMKKEQYQETLLAMIYVFRVQF